MPSSQYQQINEIVESIIVADPKSILDIGAGFGKYGALAREYLELQDNAWAKADWKRRIDAIEGFERYITPFHKYIYDNIFIGNAQDIVPSLKDHYDLILLIDIIEHFEKDEGIKLINNCLKISDNILLSTPHKFFAQRDVYGNSMETHRSLWAKGDFRQFGRHCFIPNDISLICFMGAKSTVIERRFLNFQKKAKAWLPLLVYPYRAMKIIIGFFA
jgi:hypothetical protein